MTTSPELAPQTGRPPTGAPCWIDLLTSDADRAREFYCDLFGWTAGEASAEFGGYFMFFREGQPVAGAMPGQPDVDAMDQWGIYLQVDDAHKALESAVSAGAHVRQPAVDIADLGTSAVIDDPGGARIGLWQVNTFAGFGGVREGMGMPAWAELHTRNYDQVVAFYRDVFGWDVHSIGDTPEFRYSTLGPADDAYGGILDAAAFLPPDAPAMWSVYFGAGDGDGLLARAVELGGSVVTPAEDTPYGRVATVADPMGTLFKLVGRTAAQR
jgi:predicted enzyme related to lactoylglutathione lyase